MKKIIVILCLMLFSTSLIYGQKTRYGQTAIKPNPVEYPIKVHISATHIRHFCKGGGTNISCGDGLYADAILNGKKIELGGEDVIVKKRVMLIIPGDYQVKLTKDNNSGGALFGQEYELLLPEGIVWRCTVTGVSE